MIEAHPFSTDWPYPYIVGNMQTTLSPKADQVHGSQIATNSAPYPLQAGVYFNVCKKVGQWQLHRPQRISRFQSLAFIAVMDPAFVLEFYVLAKREFSIGVTFSAPLRLAPLPDENL